MPNAALQLLIQPGNLQRSLPKESKSMVHGQHSVSFGKPDYVFPLAAVTVETKTLT